MDTIRLNALELLYKFDIEKEKLNKIEESIYNKNDMYHILIIRAIENLKNTYCLESLRNNTWKPEEFAFMDKDILNPEKWQVLQDQRMPKNINIKRKGSHKCPKCKSWYTTFSQAQTRSADEGMTVRVECHDCSYVFKL